MVCAELGAASPPSKSSGMRRGCSTSAASVGAVLGCDSASPGSASSQFSPQRFLEPMFGMKPA